MVTFLLLCAFGVAAFVVLGAVALPLLAISGVIWLVMLPIKLFFRLIFGLGGALFGLVLAPFVMLLVALALVVALVAAVFALLTPLLPFALLALFVWAIYRLSAPRKPAAPPPMPGFWT